MKSKARSRKSKVGSRKSEVGSQKSEDPPRLSYGSVLPSLRASSPIWANEASLARTRERGAEERRACNDLS